MGQHRLEGDPRGQFTVLRESVQSVGEEGWQEDLIVGELTEGVCGVRIVRVWEVLGWGGVGSVLCEPRVWEM